jgi:GT2 family glycosyltransferase
MFVVFWWRALPLGIRTYLPEQLPLDRSALAALTAEFAASQLAARLPQLGGPAHATYDGKPFIRLNPVVLQHGGDLLAQLDALADPSADSAKELSVVVCTRDRPESLERCLVSLSLQRSSPGQIIVVDNSSNRTAMRVTESFAGVEYIHEGRPGLSIARNAGIAASRGALLAFTDDDVEVNPSWSAEIVRAFGPEVESVTGLVLPARLDTAAQCYFQFRMGGFGAGCIPLTFDCRFFGETCATGSQVWRIGAGANMAFRRSVFDRVGLFDERLGAGASGCSEDSELWYRILASGGACRFEPRAVVAHHNREQWGELRRQVRAYMKGHVSALFVQAARYRHYGNMRRVFVQLPSYFARAALCALRDGGGVPRLQILGEEIAGWLCSLQYAFRPRWRAQAHPVLHSRPMSASARETL